jgi:hypothetical protein
MSRIVLAVAVLASFTAFAAAGRGKHRAKARPKYFDVQVRDDGDYQEIDYCVAAPAKGDCPAKVQPPWVPTGPRRKRRLGFDDAGSASSSTCCYVAAWGQPEPHIEPSRPPPEPYGDDDPGDDAP